jgi:hypothetical protein
LSLKAEPLKRKCGKEITMSSSKKWRIIINCSDDEEDEISPDPEPNPNSITGKYSGGIDYNPKHVIKEEVEKTFQGEASAISSRYEEAEWGSEAEWDAEASQDRDRDVMKTERERETGAAVSQTLSMSVSVRKGARQINSNSNAQTERQSSGVKIEKSSAKASRCNPQNIQTPGITPRTSKRSAAVAAQKRLSDMCGDAYVSHLTSGEALDSLQSLSKKTPKRRKKEDR